MTRTFSAGYLAANHVWEEQKTGAACLSVQLATFPHTVFTLVPCSHSYTHFTHTQVLGDQICDRQCVCLVAKNLGYCVILLSLSVDLRMFRSTDTRYVRHEE